MRPPDDVAKGARAAGDGARRRQPRPLVIGLSGPIGCGKSTVARMLADVGGTVIDADRLARRATEPGSSALMLIEQRFGRGVVAADGSLDRSALGRIVFADAGALADLERIVHPQVRRLVEQELADASREGVPFVVIEAIKLVEGGLAERCDEVWLIDCLPATQRARLAGRGIAPDDVEQRLATQGADLAGRLAAQLEGRLRVRRISTEADLGPTRQLIEDRLADALEATFFNAGR